MHTNPDDRSEATDLDQRLILFKDSEDPSPDSPWVKYRDIRYVTDQAERGRLLDIMAGRHREGTPSDQTGGAS